MLSDLAFGLAGRGRNVTVITSRQRYDAAKDTLPARETVNGVSVYRIWTSKFGRANLVGRAIDYLTFYMSATWRLWRTTSAGDIVIAKTDPPMLSVIAVPVCWLRGARLVNWLQDIFPEVAIALGLGQGRLAGRAFGLMRALRDWSLRQSSRNVVLGARMAERIRDCRVQNGRIAIIPNWADGAFIHSVAHADNPLRRSWGLDASFVVGYSGNLGRAHDYMTMLDAAACIERSRIIPNSQRMEDAETKQPLPVSSDPKPRSLSPSHAVPEITWLFIGGGALYAQLQMEVDQRQLSSVRFEPYQPRKRLAESLSAADLHLVSLRPELEGLIVPSKVYGIAAAGRPAIFIGDRDGEIARLLHQFDCGITIDAGDGEGLARAIVSLASDPVRARQMGARARQAFDTQFDKALSIDKWDTLLSEIGAEKP